GQTVTFTATVNPVSPGAGTPTGTVTFTIDGTPQAPVTLTTNTATLSTSSLSVGTHTITAAYSGDSNFNASSSSNFTQTVNKADSTTAVTSSANPVCASDSITFTATVSPVAPGSGTPTGSVQFRVDGNNVGTVTLTNGIATYTTTLSSGSHTVTGT